MRSIVALATALIVLLAACSGAPPAPEAVPTASPEEPPEALASVDTELALHGTSEVVAAAGEEITLDHVAANLAAGARSLRFQVLGADLEVKTAISGLRLDPGAVIPLVTTVTVPDDAEAGDVFGFDLVAVQADDIGQRAEVSVEVRVGEPAARPTLLDTTAETDTNEKVVVYVLSSAGAVDNVDAASLRVVGGGFHADLVEASANGTITYHPFRNVTGDDLVLFELCNPDGRCDTALVAVTVNTT